MDRISHILLPTDFSPCADVAAAFALHLARKTGARLTLAHVSLLFEEDAEAAAADTRTEVLAEPETRVRRRADDQLAGCDTSGVRVDTVQIRGLTVGATLADFAQHKEVDLIVMGTHGRRGFKRWLLGSVAEELVRRAPCPVFSVKEEWGGKPEDLHNMLIPIDFSLASRTALHAARALASLLGARLEVLHVVQPPPYPDIYTYASMEDFYDEAREKSLEVMHMLLGEDGPEVEARCSVVAGHPAREILKFAETGGADMILMAHLGISGLAERILGSVTEHVVRGAKCPVLTADLGQ